jgi:hypothetical protein
MLVVGSVLNAIKQGDALWSVAHISWWKLALIYYVPFCVATFGAYAAYRGEEKVEVNCCGA